MSKQELLGIYRTAFNRIQLAYASTLLWCYPDTPAFFEELHGVLDRKLQIFPSISNFVNDKAALQIATEELLNLAYRAALNDLLELTKSYCHDTQQLHLLKSQPWFLFWRLIRNCFAHNMRFNFTPEEKRILPITWSGVTIHLQMNKTPLPQKVFPREKIIDLIESARIFVESDLQ